MRSKTSSRVQTTISAAAEGVGARRSATKSAMVISVSWPTAEITGTEQAAMARATASSLKVHRSSSRSEEHTSELQSLPTRRSSDLEIGDGDIGLVAHSGDHGHGTGGDGARHGLFVESP